MLQFPDMTIQVNSIKETEHENKKTKKSTKIPVLLSKKYILKPGKSTLLECQLQRDENLENVTGVVVPNESLSTISSENKLYISVLSFADDLVTLPNKTEIGRFHILTSDQAENLFPIDLSIISLARMKSSEDVKAEINQLIQNTIANPERQSTKPPPEYNKLWFPTPETCTDVNVLSPLQREINDQILNLQQLEKIDPSSSTKDREIFLRQFDWEDSVLTDNQKSTVEELLVEFSNVFAKHRFDVGHNTELKIKLTPEHDLPIYTQGPPTPIHLRDELMIELALMHYYGLITTLPQSKYSSPLFAHRKQSGKLKNFDRPATN